MLKQRRLLLAVLLVSLTPMAGVSYGCSENPTGPCLDGGEPCERSSDCCSGHCGGSILESGSWCSRVEEPAVAFEGNVRTTDGQPVQASIYVCTKSREECDAAKPYETLTWGPYPYSHADSTGWYDHGGYLVCAKEFHIKAGRHSYGGETVDAECTPGLMREVQRVDLVFDPLPQ